MSSTTSLWTSPRTAGRSTSPEVIVPERNPVVLVGFFHSGADQHLRPEMAPMTFASWESADGLPDDRANWRPSALGSARPRLSRKWACRGATLLPGRGVSPTDNSVGTSIVDTLTTD